MEGDTDVTQLPAPWDTVTWRPAIVNTADRASPALADTENVVVPLPVPDAPLVIVTKGLSPTTVQPQLAPAKTLTLVVPPTAEIDTVVGETENEHGTVATVMRIRPVAFWKRAVMSASPAATPVTIPRSTLATPGLDDCHVASAVTDRLEPSKQRCGRSELCHRADGERRRPAHDDRVDVFIRRRSGGRRRVSAARHRQGEATAQMRSITRASSRVKSPCVASC